MFVPRLTQPPNTDTHWINTAYGGLNPCILGYPSYGYGNCLANCVGYAYGRRYEILGRDPHLCINQAAIWWTYNDGYPRSQDPTLGAIACWDDGGSGHVAVVEEIQYSGGQVVSCTISESVYGGTIFRTWTITRSSGWFRFNSSYVFQGFINIPIPPDDIEMLLLAIKRRKGR